jgi:hypothetical protein
MIEEHFCRPYLSNISSLDKISTDETRFNANESLDRCGEWKEYSSLTRIRDGLKNCLTVMTLGDGSDNCRNRFDELFFGVGRTISSFGCNNERQDKCSLLRQYISQSSTSSKKNDGLQERSWLSFRFHCDTFSDLQGNEDETPLECQEWWICPEDQQRWQSGQCREASWGNDFEWDCANADDEHGRLNFTTEYTLQSAFVYNFTNRSFFVPSSCPGQSSPFLCLSLDATRQGFSCLNWSQIGDGNIDCAGGMDECNTLPHCSESLSILGSNYLCPSTITCIPYYFHCSKEECRCPNRSDDRLWCSRQHRPSNCSGRSDFVCFDGRCAEGGRCDRYLECAFGEDEYMCDYPSSLSNNFIGSRKLKRSSRGKRPSILRFSRYPLDVNITQSSSIVSTVDPPITSSPNPFISSASLYMCNRGVGILLTKNHALVACFCPPQYSGNKCQFHADRVSVILHVDLSIAFFNRK